jgi:hypothetical protein
MIIQLMPYRSRNWPSLVAKNVSCIGMNTSPPSDTAEKMLVARPRRLTGMSRTTPIGLLHTCPPRGRRA